MMSVIKDTIRKGSSKVNQSLQHTIIIIVVLCPPSSDYDFRFASAALFLLDYNLFVDPILQIGYMGNDADQSVALRQGG